MVRSSGMSQRITIYTATAVYEQQMQAARSRAMTRNRRCHLPKSPNHQGCEALFIYATRIGFYR
jgi:hypothetical protein